MPTQPGRPRFNLSLRVLPKRKSKNLWELLSTHSGPSKALPRPTPKTPIFPLISTLVSDGLNVPMLLVSYVTNQTAVHAGLMVQPKL